MVTPASGNEDNSSFARLFKLDNGNEDNSSFARFFARFFKLDKYAMFSFAMTSGLASDSDKFKIMRRAQKFEDTGPQKNFIFLNNPFNGQVFLEI